MDDRERRREEELQGIKGGSAEAYAGRMFYEPTVTAVTDMIVPATRIQWGPVFAGLLIALSITFLFTALGIATGLGIKGLGYWIVGFGALGLFLGSLMAARTARAELIPAILHGAILWTLVMMVHVFAFGGGGLLVATMGASPGAAVPAASVTGFGWWFFLGFLILLAASIIGGIVGVNPPEHHEEPVAPQP